jgi:hypothetical protein
MQPEDVSYSFIANTAIRVFGSTSQVFFLKDKPNIPDNIFEKNHLIFEKTGAYPSVSLEEGIRDIGKRMFA